MNATTGTRCITQLCAVGGVALDPDGGINMESELYALADDGTVWYFADRTRGWRQMPGLPQPAPAEGPANV